MLTPPRRVSTQPRALGTSHVLKGLNVDNHVLPHVERLSLGHVPVEPLSYGPRLLSGGQKRAIYT